MQFEVEIYQNETGEWVATATDYAVSATGRTENEALSRMMDALTVHFKSAAKKTAHKPAAGR
jgi:predicted RNase H-like HicB family nuclease